MRLSFTNHRCRTPWRNRRPEGREEASEVLINSQIDVLPAGREMDEGDCPGTQAVTCISAQRWLEQFRVDRYRYVHRYMH